MKKFLSVIMIFAGVSTLVSVILPVAVSQLQFSLSSQTAIIDPSQTTKTTELIPAVSADEGDVDYTSPTNWFSEDLVQSASKPIIKSNVSYYTLSVPSVGLKDVTVEIEGTDLKKNAIQYPGTAIPGTYGNAVVFGHSTLPQLYKVGDPVSIFNPLVKVKVGDEITVYFDGITYRYIVRETMVVLPTQIDVLAQRYDRFELTLITCTPLGTYLRRFVARAELVN